jgi:LPXTG-motif cell wall-anchored protein
VLTTVGSVLSCRAVTAGVQAADVQAAAIGGTPALLNPVTLRVAQADSVAAFTTAPGRTTSTTRAPALPRTGMSETLLLVIGGMMAAVALGLRRASAPVTVRARRR